MVLHSLIKLSDKSTVCLHNFTEWGWRYESAIKEGFMNELELLLGPALAAWAIEKLGLG